MKKIIISIIAVIGFSVSAFSLPINECKTNIYFGNGVWNKQFSRDNCVKDSAAECSQRKLNKVIELEIIKGNPALEAKYGTVKLQYNWGGGYMQDVLETYYQLKNEGQVNDLEFFTVMMILTGGDVPLSTYATALLLESMPFVAEVEQSNVDTMLTKYYNESFQYSHRVLLVSHSQGNLFANRVYDSINPAGFKTYFANVQVASPASSVHASMGAYVTGWVDPIINPIPGSMESNADLDFPGGHAFVAAYLDSQDSYEQIVRAIRSQLEALDNTPSQWKIVEEPNHCDSCDSYVAKVTHRFDPSVASIDNVLPYNTEAFKLYQVKGRYVLASCGGTEIEDLKDDDESKLCSRLIGTNDAIPKMETLIDGVCIGVVDSDIDYRFDKDTKELLIGSIGDNYWGGHCTHYTRHITLMVENSDNLRSFNVKEVGFDDWIELSINQEPYYTSPYTLPPNCELGTSFVTYPNKEIVSKIKEGINTLDMHVIVAGGGEGWFKIQLQ